MTTTYAPSPSLVPNRASSSAGTSHERSYLKSRRSQHRTEKRHSILSFLDKNIEGMEDKERDYSPTQRRRNTTTTATAAGTAESTTPTTDERQSRWNPFRKSSNANNSSSSSNNKNSTNSRSRRISKRRQEQLQVLEEAKKQQQQQEQASEEPVDPHEEILEAVLKSYPRKQCKSFKEHVNFAMAELTTQLASSNKIHMTPETGRTLKSKLKTKLQRQLDGLSSSSHHGRMSLSSSSHHNRSSNSTSMDFGDSHTSIKSSSSSNNHNNNNNPSPTRRRKSKAKVRAKSTRKINNNNNDDSHTSFSDHQQSQQEKERQSGNNASPEDETPAPPPTSSPTKPPDSTRSLAVPAARPVSTKSLKAIDKDDTSATSLGDDFDDDQQHPPQTPVVTMTTNTLLFDADGNLGTYTGPLCPTTGKPHGKDGKITYKHTVQDNSAADNNNGNNGTHNNNNKHSVKKYAGEWNQGTYTGTGTLLKVNGDVYKGQFLDGVVHGMGKYTYYKNKRVFEGRHVQGDRVEGSMTYTDGSFYKGQWYNHKRHGRGIYKFHDGSVYKGEFLHDKIHGIGQLKWTDGSKYIGEWSKGNRHGTGKEYKADGTLRFQGMWKEGKEQPK